ncbi:hypothetical protein ACQP0C_07785 [Nocardia sp. CA-129566]|uniref:hypothetical protein n=1 Tax=Nocardia sp. CA-129566 TaxID=3239976 RepID=UPI003D97C9D1
MTARLGRGSRTVTVLIGTMLAAVAGLVVAGTVGAQPPHAALGPAAAWPTRSGR